MKGGPRGSILLVSMLGIGVLCVLLLPLLDVPPGSRIDDASADLVRARSALSRCLAQLPAALDEERVAPPGGEARAGLDEGGGGRGFRRVTPRGEASRRLGACFALSEGIDDEGRLRLKVWSVWPGRYGSDEETFARARARVGVEVRWERPSPGEAWREVYRRPLSLP